jgi:hypothetical protein
VKVCAALGFAKNNCEGNLSIESETRNKRITVLFFFNILLAGSRVEECSAEFHQSQIGCTWLIEGGK